MTIRFLPIIERELRAAARRKGTYRVRWWTTLIAALVTLICFLYVSSRPIPAGVTNPLFAALAGCAFLLCLFAGVFLTSDSLSEEKREGTLGLLFLSNLLGSDIVLGKFSALALNAFFSVLALLPVMGVPLLLGGLDWMEFSRVILALLNMLFVSLAAGMCVSAFGRSQWSVVAMTFAALLLLVCGLPILGELGPTALLASARASLGWSSSLYPFAYAFEAIYIRQPPKYWGTLFASHMIGWLLLALASRAIPRRWQDSGKVADSPHPGSFSVHRRWGAETKRRELRGEFSLVHAVGLLLGEATVMRRLIWGILGAWCLVLAWNLGSSSLGTIAFAGTMVIAFFLKVLVAFQACRFFSESRNSGALELLLCTPVQSSDIIRAQWRKLRGIFLWPSVILVLLGALAIAFIGGTAVPATGPWRAWPGGPGFEPSAARVCWLGIRLAADVLAVGWFGMYLALTLKRPILAPALTIILVLILPSILSWLALVTDVLFVSWGTTRLQEDLRQVLIRRYQGGAAPSPIRAEPVQELAPAL